MGLSSWFAVRQELSPRRRRLLTIASFLLPLLVWAVVSYVPVIWHPMVKIAAPGDVDYFQVDMLVKKQVFHQEVLAMQQAGKELPLGEPANPIYLPPPHQVIEALYSAFTTPPVQRDGLWLHQSLWQSIQLIAYAFLISSLVGVPLGILAGTWSVAGRLCLPFIEFFRYLPAPAFGALAVAVLGIYEGPKIAIIVIGTFFQQVLIISNTTRQLDYALLEAAMTLGTSRWKLLRHVVIPGVLPQLYRDQRILLGWAWTYLIVAELIGTSSGITWFITQQARYEHFDNVYAAIFIIGVIGLSTDMLLAWLGKRLFPWDKPANKE
ncbi:ABC transporter permease [Methylobacillus flagellatus]|uniref:Binding-protein-dependent transport systems inner membrane component n=1 Tax=Methylobacillus flagellatus (strain ATCC 51484 / DSM 6875 / VKM B-1610 / KT) TaxID=265072 RepID=Q1H062_METFK|nr:ABC transporter permease [Methylobacillus flagellatus]ABE50125.1 binding-protein-dependent transport systems inner membrane component [Methylobacillus flagellatus KT]